MANSGFKRLVAEEREGGRRVEVDATVGASRVDKALDEFYDLMAHVKGKEGISGDRASSEACLDEVLGARDAEAARRDFLLNRFTMEVVRELGIDTVLAPGVHAEESPRYGRDFSFAVSLTPRPPLALSDTGPVRVERPSISVEERDIDVQVDYAARRFAELGGVDCADASVVDDAWVARMLPRFGDREGFRAHIRAELEQQKERVEQQELVCRVRSALEERLVGAIPDEMYQEAKESLMALALGKIESQGMTLEAYCDEHGTSKEAFNLQVFMQAAETLRQNLALDVLARDRGIVETDEEVARAKADLPPAIAAMPDGEFERRGYKASLCEGIRRKKALSWLMDTAIVEA